MIKPMFYPRLKAALIYPWFTLIYCSASLLAARAASENIVGQVRVQCLSPALVRLEVRGPNGFENRNTFHIVSRDWPGCVCVSNRVGNEVQLVTANYTVHVPVGTSSLTNVSVTTSGGQLAYQFDGTLNNSPWLPGPAAMPPGWAFADSPRLVPPAWGITPAPSGSALPGTSGWDLSNDAPDVYVSLPQGSYNQLRADFLKLTGPADMIPFYALGLWDSRWYDYDEASALAQIDAYRQRNFPLDVLVCDTGWRVNASTGYQPNSQLFPNLPRFFAEAHAQHVQVMFNDHPEPVAATALDPTEVTYRYTNLTQLSGAGLDVWWYDRNWSVSLLSPAPNLRKEVWGMRIYQDEAIRTNAPRRPMIMANVDGIDNGIRNRAPNVAAHRFSIQWTGDIGPGNDFLNYAVKNAVHAGVQAAFPYESDDLGGHVSDPSPGDYIRWLEYGTLSPICRPHCTHNLMRMPWAFGAQAEWVVRRFVGMRYRLLPELYTAVHQNYLTGEPLLRRLDLDFPQFPEATKEGQYLLGHSLLVAPVLQAETATVPAAWLTTPGGQPGLAATYFANLDLTGAPSLSRTDSKLDFNWGTGSPGTNVPVDNFTARWLGNITIPAVAGDVSLAVASDDGIRLWVDGQLTIDNWGPNNAASTESGLILKAGSQHQLKVEYLELTGNALVSLKWRHQTSQQPVWVPPGTWINAWSGAVVKGPVNLQETAPLERIPLYIRAGSLFALADQQPFAGSNTWDHLTLDVYPSSDALAQTAVYEDDQTTTAYRSGAWRQTAVRAWADDNAKSVTISIDPAIGTFPGAVAQRRWTARFRRPVSWAPDWVPQTITLNGQPVGPVILKVKNTTAMPLGADIGAPDADVYEITLPPTAVTTTNLLIARFSPSTQPWTCGDIGASGAAGNALDGGAKWANSTWNLRGGGTGWFTNTDGGHFLYQSSRGDIQITGQYLGQFGGNGGAGAGLMVRETMDPGSRDVILAMTPGQQLVMSARSAAGNMSQVLATTNLAGPVWLRLTRTGNTFNGYFSTNRLNWQLVQSVTLANFPATTLAGAAVSAAIPAVTVPATNSFGTALVGVSSGLSGGVYGTESTNLTSVVLGELSLSNQVSLSAIPNQMTAQGTPTPPIPFHVYSSSGTTPVLQITSSNTNVLTAANASFVPQGQDWQMVLTPPAGAWGSTLVTLTAFDGVATASCQFTLTVSARTGVLLSDTFTGYAAGNLPGQAYRGPGFAAGGAWSGLDKTYGQNVPTAATVAATGLATASGDASTAKIAMKGDGSNLAGWPDITVAGPFAAAGLLDSAAGTIGGDNVNGTLYVSFLIRAAATSRSSEYGGLQLSRSDDGTGVLLGNEWNAVAYSLWAPVTSTSADLLNPAGNYLTMDNAAHRLIARIKYAAGNDTLDAWLDPDATLDEDGQTAANIYHGTITGDFSFDRLFFRGGNNNIFEFGDLKMGNTWSAVLPVKPVITAATGVVLQPPQLSEQSFLLFFAGTPGQSYSVLTNTNLAINQWAVVSQGVFAAGTAACFAGILTNDPTRFYRVSCP